MNLLILLNTSQGLFKTDVKSLLKINGKFNFANVKKISSLLNLNLINIEDIKGRVRGRKSYSSMMSPTFLNPKTGNFKQLNQSPWFLKMKNGFIKT